MTYKRLQTLVCTTVYPAYPSPYIGVASPIGLGLSRILDPKFGEHPFYVVREQGIHSLRHSEPMPATTAVVRIQPAAMRTHVSTSYHTPHGRGLVGTQLRSWCLPLYLWALPC